jgi:type I restriction enzyme R subunit
MAFLSEAQLEAALLAQLTVLGYACASDDLIGPDGKQPERDAYDEVVLKTRLAAAVARLNPALPPEPQADAVRRLIQSELPSLLEENRRLHRVLTEGADVEYYADDGTLTAGKVRLLDFDNTANNDWLAVQQFVVVAGQVKRRPDVVIFVNGLPLAVVELKAPGGENATLAGAFNQLQTYKQQIPALFRCNALLVTSDGLSARVGSLTADSERFMPWRTTDGVRIEPKGTPELATLIEGVFEQSRFLDLLRHFTVFGEGGDGLIKIIAGYHQFHAVKRAIISTLRASQLALAEDPAVYGLPSVKDQPPGDHKAGVIWHTQGSGKSLLMAFYAGLLVFDTRMANPTLVVLTDRNDLDDQLFATFAMCKDLIRQTPVQAQDRDHLRTLLNRASGGVIFTTLQKFSPAIDETEFPTLTERANVVVIADEAPTAANTVSRPRWPARPVRLPTALPNTCATPCRMPLSLVSPARPSRPPTSIHRRCLATTSTSMTSAARWKMAPRCRFITNRAWRASNSTRTRRHTLTPRSRHCWRTRTKPAPSAPSRSGAPSKRWSAATSDSRRWLRISSSTSRTGSRR